MLALALLVPGAPPAAAQFPEREPTNAEIVFGCAPGPVEPFYPSDPPLPPETEPLENLPPVAATLVVDGGAGGPPIAGMGFNLEHALWSCPTFRPSLRRRIIEPFLPAFVRIDTGQLPLAPDGVPAEQLGWADYQAVMDEPKYQPSWEMIRRLNRRGIQVLLGVWGAPGAFTDDGTRRGQLRPEYFDKYVEYYTAVVDYLVRQKGLQIWAATIMNEPDGGDGTFIPPEDLAEVARRLGPSLAPYGVKLYGPDTASAENALAYLRPLLDDPGIVPYLAAVATHQYFPSPYVERLVESVRAAGHELPVIITEYTSFQFGQLDRGEEASDEVGFLLDIANTAVSLYNDGVDAALYWDAVDYYQAGHAAITTWGLLRGPDDAFYPRKRYWGMLQILPYLRPGAQVLSTYLAGDNDGLSALAVHTPGDGRQDIAIILVNQGPPTLLRVSLHALPDVRTLELYLTDADHDLAHLGHVDLADGDGELYLPARAIATLAPTTAPDESAATAIALTPNEWLVAQRLRGASWPQVGRAGGDGAGAPYHPGTTAEPPVR